MTGRPTRRLLVAMTVEEWRLHARAFGGRRFLAFPLLVAAMAGGAVWALRYAGTPVDDVAAGVAALVFGFGLYTGSVGLVSRDALRGLLGGHTLLLEVSRWLPLGERRVLAAFLVKDVGYYAALLLVPVTVGFVPAVVAGALPPAALPLLLAALVGTFATGIGCTLLGIAASAQGQSGRALVAATVAGVGLGWWRGVDPLALGPYALYARAGDPVAVAVGAGVAIAVPAAGVLAFDPSFERPARSVTDRFGALQDRLSATPLGDADGLVTKSLLDVARSDGGLWKVAFSGAVVFAVSAFLVETAARVTGVPPSPGVTFGALLGLTGFTTYNWLTQFDDPARYAALPVDTAALFDAKRRAFALLGPPTALGFLGLAAGLYRATGLDLAVGAALAVGLAAYLFGLTVALAGLQPGEFLFDAVRYAAFTAGVAVIYVPVLVVGLAVDPVTPALYGALGATALAAAVAGHWLYHRSVPRWARRYRTA
ncbi:MAG: hypothetical protein ABEJ42_04645 [Halobacteriaceae archaeon]